MTSTFVCTYCGGDKFIQGPTGGMSVNILCANEKCRHWFNDMGPFGIEDLNKVEPTNESKEEARKAEEAEPTINLGIEGGMLNKLSDLYEEGKQIFLKGQPAKDCFQNKPYGSYAMPYSDGLRLAGWLDAFHKVEPRENFN